MKLHALTFLLSATLMAGAESPATPKPGKKPGSKSASGRNSAADDKSKSAEKAGKKVREKPAEAVEEAPGSGGKASGAAAGGGAAAAGEAGAKNPGENGAGEKPEVPTGEKSAAKPEKPENAPEESKPGEKPAEPAAEEAVAAPPAAPSSGFDLSSSEAPAEFAARFFARLERGDIEGAYDGLIKGSKIAEHPGESRALKNKTREAIAVFGAITGFELVESKEVGAHLLRRTYVSIGKQFPLRWRLYFYKPDDAWRLVDMRVDDRLAGMFGETEEKPGPETAP